MRVLALDYGSARCGCAVSDPTGVLATPLDPELKSVQCAAVPPLMFVHVSTLFDPTWTSPPDPVIVFAPPL